MYILGALAFEPAGERRRQKRLLSLTFGPGSFPSALHLQDPSSEGPAARLRSLSFPSFSINSTERRLSHPYDSRFLHFTHFKAAFSPRKRQGTTTRCCWTFQAERNKRRFVGILSNCAYKGGWSCRFFLTCTVVEVSSRGLLLTCAGNWFADHNERPNNPCTIIRRFPFPLSSSVWHRWIEMIKK